MSELVGNDTLFVILSYLGPEIEYFFIFFIIALAAILKNAILRNVHVISGGS